MCANECKMGERCEKLMRFDVMFDIRKFENK